MVPAAGWLVLTSRPTPAVGCLLFSLAAVLRLGSSRVRRWTDENQWKFLLMMIPPTLLVALGPMPTG
jgi:hypothetical protein